MSDRFGSVHEATANAKGSGLISVKLSLTEAPPSASTKETFITSSAEKEAQYVF